MPNLCDNTLKIKGIDLQDFVDHNMNEEQSLCFEKSVPFDGSDDDRKEWNVWNVCTRATGDAPSFKPEMMTEGVPWPRRYASTLVL